jgi:hypothetical protein
MEVDVQLIDAAAAALRGPSVDRCACAAYAQGGELVVETGGSAERRIVARFAAAGRLIAAVATLEASPEGPILGVRRPDARTLDAIARQARRHTPIAVAGSWPGAVTVRPLWELLLDAGVPADANPARDAGRFGRGMKAIAAELGALATSVPAQVTAEEFQLRMLSTLSDPRLREIAKRPAPIGSAYPTPGQLPSPALRHVWLAFEEAAEAFVYEFVDAQRGRLSELGCNEADVVHVKQGFEALRNAVAVLIVHVAVGGPVANECPFFPYGTGLLEHGVPLNRYLARPDDDLGTSAVARLAALLARTEPGGFLPYLRQRRLFSVDLFDGGGTGHCPFAPLTAALLAGFARALDAARERGDLLSETEIDTRFAEASRGGVP